MNDDYIIRKKAYTEFIVTATKTAKNPHQDTWQPNKIPKSVPPEYKSTQISPVRQNQIRCKFMFGDELSQVDKAYTNNMARFMQALSMEQGPF